MATDVTGRDRPAIGDVDPAAAAAAAAAQGDADERAQISVDPVEEWERQSFPASDPPQNW